MVSTWRTSRGLSKEGHKQKVTFKKKGMPYVNETAIVTGKLNNGSEKSRVEQMKPWNRQYAHNISTKACV